MHEWHGWLSTFQGHQTFLAEAHTACRGLRRSVHGLDATAAQTFGTLYSRLHAMGVELVLTHLDSVHITTSAAGADQQVCSLARF